MKIHGIIVHKIEKAQRGKGQPNPAATISPRINELDNTNPLVIELAEYIWKAYRKGKTFGSFDEEAEVHPAQNWIRDYLNDPAKHPFIPLTLSIMKRLKFMLEKENFSTGGHVLFLHFTKNNSPWFMVVMIKDKKGFIFTDDLDLKDIKELELDKLHQAIRVDISRWLDEAENAYLSFIKAGVGDIAHYFLDTFGCTDSIPSKQATKTVLSVIENVCETANLSRSKIRSIKSAICDYMEKNISGVSLSEIEMQLNFHIDKEYWNLFTELANSDEYRISDNFEPNKQVLASHRQIKFDTTHWKLSIEKGAIGKPNSDAEVIFDSNDNSLTIKNVPQTQIPELLEIINIDEDE